MNPANPIAAARPRLQRERIPLRVWSIVVLLALIAVASVFRQQTAVGVEKIIEHWETRPAFAQGPTALPSPDVQPAQVGAGPRIKFNPPFVLTDTQWDYVDTAKIVINNPAARGVYKPALNFDPNLLELYMSVLWSENKLSHYDQYGNVAWSYSGCCLGGAQVYAQTSICTFEELLDPDYNVWCGAAIFKDYNETWGKKAGLREYEITVATYKNAVLLNDDKTFVLEKGLPIIPEDDPANPYDLFSQSQSAFVYDGQSMFKFVSD